MEVNRKSNTPMMEPKQNGIKKDYFHVPLDTHNGVNKTFLYKRYNLSYCYLKSLLVNFSALVTKFSQD